MGAEGTTGARFGGQPPTALSTAASNLSTVATSPGTTLSDADESEDTIPNAMRTPCNKSSACTIPSASQSPPHAVASPTPGRNRKAASSRAETPRDTACPPKPRIEPALVARGPGVDHKLY